MEVYKKPLYYEAAFNFVDPKRQVDNFLKLIKRFSKIKAKRFLDVACGPSLQLREIAKRGYESVGLDSSYQMIQYLKRKAKEEKANIETIRADMRQFRLRKKADFAFIMMGSLTFRSNNEFIKHLDSVASSLNKGGLYVVQNQLFDLLTRKRQSWFAKRNGIRVKAIFEWNFENTISQLYKEKITLKIKDNKRRINLTQTKLAKFIFPEEFKLLVRTNSKFEFLGWYAGSINSWNLDRPLDKFEKAGNNIVILRKR